VNAAARELPGRGTILNLCFHGIGTPSRTLEPDEARYWVGAAQFEEMLDAVRPYPSVRLTFDDGNASDIDMALPVLIKRGLVATFFVIAARVGRPGTMTKNDLRELVRARMTVGSHGMHHRAWNTVDDRELHSEIAEARQVIAEATGDTPDRVACPYGSYNRRVLNSLRRERVSRVYTVDGGAAREDSWLQSRYVVERSDTPQTLERLARLPDGPAAARVMRSLKGAIKRLR